ncbi:hypothetical protein [Anaeroselena agilis]|uniref:Uncharacterized protein n=1 Tax=Anaeroselena agilis TaxID=3063788 RepID=A0ABU3NWA0_9FIRM|nr:hypothetical protein [Selenomonadales bacterium 4137-cl]
MHIVITVNGLYFSGKVGDFRRFLALLASHPPVGYRRDSLR